jgi:LmbE family N-acetylglucosaminyl deacetylase
MKLRIYFRPSIAVLWLGAFAVLFWCAALVFGSGVRWLALPFAVFYTLLFAISGWALWRIHVIEHWTRWDASGRLLILAPHEDDCVISAGGIAARNQRLGGVTRIVYLAPDEAAGLAELRAAEARAAWREAGLAPGDLRHLDLLPPLRRRDPVKLQAAARTLRAIIDDFQPTTIVMPMFEGGHIHHDMVAALVGSIVTSQDKFAVFEAPEYSPNVSLNDTPHRIIALSVRWLFGLVSYQGPPDGIDGRPLLKFRLDPTELDCKRRMLAAFASQNAPSLVMTRCYPDRLVRWDQKSRRRHPFDFQHSWLRLVLAARLRMPAKIVDRIFPLQRGTIGREGRITDWLEESTLEGNPRGNAG